MTDSLSSLNPEQQKPVLQTDGPMIILAGAGSGKTRVITQKVVYLIEGKGVSTDSILMVTFTNKAADEMKQRIKKLLNSPDLPLVTTFHSLCAKILRVDGKSIGIPPNFLIYDTEDQKEAIKEAIKLLGFDPKEYKPNSILGTISQAKNELMSENDYASLARGHYQERVSRIYPIYQKILRENNAMDFDDLILKTVTLLREVKEICTKYQNKFKYIMVDEYQDTNRAQYILTKTLSNRWKNICVVGDFSQSIYSFRGADFQNLSKFEDDFPGTKIFKLSQNYRSTQKILDAASSVISKNTSHPILSLWTEKQEGEDVELYESYDEQNEAEFILTKISEIRLQNPDFKYSDFSILYRTNAQSRVFEEVFLHNSIPYILIGGVRFYERREIKDILAYIKILENPKDKISIKRIEKLGKARFQKFLEFQEKNSTEISTIEIMDQVLKETNYLSLYDEKDEEDLPRLENIKELRSVAIEFPNITQFLENVSLVEQEYLPDNPLEDKNSRDAIKLMTLHSAKGLEFPIVFMVGMEEGLFPHSRSLMDRNELEEERRLCYVGMTRAKEKLFLTFAKRRLFFGQKSANIVSRFIMELPEDIISSNLNLERKDEFI